MDSRKSNKFPSAPSSSGGGSSQPKSHSDDYSNPILMITGYPLNVSRSKFRKFLSQIGVINKCFFYRDHATVQYKTKMDIRELLRNPPRFENNVLRIKVVSRTDLKKVASQDVNPSPNLHLVESDKLIDKLSKCSDIKEQIKCIMFELCLPYQDLVDKYSILYQDMETTLGSVFQGCQAMPFGSTVTGLAFKGSDLDLFVLMPNVYCKDIPPDTPLSVYFVNESRKILFRRPDLFRQIISITKAKTPILKCIHKRTGISSDINFKNMLGVCNSRLVNYLLSLDERLKPFTIIIKYWAKINEITSPGKFTNYALVMLILFYLQQPHVGLLPTVNALQKPQFDHIIEGWNAGYNPNFSSVNLSARGINWSIPELLKGFFQFYDRFEYAMEVISPFIGKTILRTAFLQSGSALDATFWRYKDLVKNHKVQEFPIMDKCVCVQDPFELNHNLTRGITLSTLKHFQACCKLASEICVEALQSNALNKLLVQLFTPVNLFADTNNVTDITILPSSFLQSKTNDDLAGSQNNSEEYLRKKWFEHVNELLLIILMKIFKFDLTLNKNDEQQTKAARTDNVKDIHDDFIESFNIHCLGYYSIYIGRKKVSKKLSKTKKKGLDLEIDISNYLLDKYYKAAHILGKKPILNFILKLSAYKKPTRIMLTLENSDANLKNYFYPFATFLKKWLPIWLERFTLNGDESSCSVGKEGMTEPSTSSVNTGQK